MLRGLYTAASGMIAQQRKHDAVTNNISNLNTPGFKQGNVVERSFPEMLISLTNGGGGANSVRIGRLNTGVLAEENLSSYIQGDLQETRNPADFAITSGIGVPGIQFDASGKAITPDGDIIYQPQAFFSLVNQDGEVRYTRNGKFSVNADGEIITTTGLKVLGRDRQPVVIDRELGELKITPDGQFIDAYTGEPIVNGAGEPVGLLISRINEPNLLIQEGDGHFRLESDNVPEAVGPADEVTISQGFVERSNVDATASMVELMSALRAYEANQKVVQYYDRSLDKAVNEVGRV